jgi:hypothetical protein
MVIGRIHMRIWWKKRGFCVIYDFGSFLVMLKLDPVVLRDGV